MFGTKGVAARLRLATRFTSVVCAFYGQVEFKRCATLWKYW